MAKHPTAEKKDAVSQKQLSFRSRRDKFFTKYQAIVFLLIFFAVFGYLAHKMTLPIMLNVMMKTAYSLLMETVFYLMAIVVLTGALCNLLLEFKVDRLVEKMLRPLMRPLFNLPGIAALGGVLTFLSDNPAIICLSKDKNFSAYFKKVQFISLTNFGTAFGMGLVVVMFMASLGYGASGVIGLVGAFCGAIVSTRLMQRFILKSHPEFKTESVNGDEIPADVADTTVSPVCEEETKEKKTLFLRILDALLDGGKNGVNLGVSIIPGVLIISTAVMMLTFGPSEGGYQGVAYEGVALLPYLAGKINFLFEWLFGFQNPELIAFPMTSLGAVGAALGLIPKFDALGLVDGNAIAVFTAMGMCWSGFLSTHTAMLDSLGYRSMTSKAIIAHTFGGLVAGIVAHWVYVLFALIA